MARRRYRNASPSSTLTGGVNASATSLVVVAVTGWPVVFPFTAVVDYGLSTVEAVLVSNVVGQTLTVTRGYDSTTAVSHSAGATVQPMALAVDYDEANAHVNATAAVHGLSGAVVGTTDTQTLNNKTLASPVMTGTAAGANFTASGSVVATGNVQSSGTLIGGAVSTGAVTATGNATVGGTFGVTGVTTAGQVNATGVAVSGNGTVGGTLGVTGTTTLAAASATTLSTSGLATLASASVTAAPSVAASAVNKLYADDRTFGHAARRYRSTTQSLTSLANTDISLDASVFDVGSDMSATGYTAPATGWYTFNYRVEAAIAASSFMFSGLRIGTTEVSRGSRSPNTSGVTDNAASSGSDTLQLTSGQVVKLFALASGASPVAQGGTSITYLTGQRIG